MRKNNLILLTMSVLLLSSCSINSNSHVHEWDVAFDNGDGTHTMICHSDNRHTLSEAHTYGEGRIIKEATETEPGTLSYKCSKCGNSKTEQIQPTKIRVYDQEIVDSKYKYTKNGVYTNTYYKTDKDGVFGNPNYLFEYTNIPNGYSEISYIKNDGKHFIDTGLKNSKDYSFGNNIFPSSNGRIPAEYVEVEYIEGTGTQYIDTGLRLNDSMVVDLITEIQYTKATEYFWSGADVYAQYTYDYFKRLDKFKCETHFNESKKLIVKANDKVVVNKDFSSVHYKNDILGIFKCGAANNKWWVKEGKDKPNPMKVFNQTITINGVVERDFVPCYKKDTLEAGLFDLITREFYKNIGTGSFLYGDVVAPTLSPGIDEGNIKIFGDNSKGTGEIYENKLFSFVVVNDLGEKISEFVSVRRDIDERPGFLDLKTNKFVEMPLEGFEAGTMVGHVFEEKLIEEPMYNKNGKMERKCKLCGKVENAVVPKLSYKVDISKDDNVVSVDVYKDYLTLDIANATTAYTRSINTFNYSKSQASLILKITVSEGYIFDRIECDTKIEYKENDVFIVITKISDDLSITVKAKAKQ